MQRIAATLLVVSSLVLIASAAGYMWWLHPGYNALDFSPAAWAEADAETRGHMVDSLLSRHELVGTNQQSLLDLLGEPDAALTEAEIDASRGIGDTQDNPPNRLEVPVRARLLHARYKLGYGGRRQGAPFVFPYSLHAVFRNGTVVRTYIDD